MTDGKEHHYCSGGPKILSFIIHGCQMLHFQSVSVLNAARNLRNLLCESRRGNSLANFDKHLFKTTFVLCLKAQDNNCWSSWEQTYTALTHQLRRWARNPKTSLPGRQPNERMSSVFWGSMGGKLPSPCPMCPRLENSGDLPRSVQTSGQFSPSHFPNPHFLFKACLLIDAKHYYSNWGKEGRASLAYLSWK